jgi:hypothetical protein
MERLLRLASRLLGLTLLALPIFARADVIVPLGHGKLHLPMPEGYCSLDTDLARESSLFDVEAQTFVGRARLLVMAADCGELTSFRQHHGAVTRIVTFVLALKDDQAVRRPDAERAQYLDGLARQFGKAEAKDFAANAQQWWNISNPAAEPLHFGFAERDSSAVYLQAVRQIGRYQPESIASVSAVTLADGYEVAANFYMHADEHGLPGLLALAEQEAQGLVAANTAPPAPAQDASAPAADQPASADGGPMQALNAALSQSGSTIIMAAGGVLLVCFVLLLMSRRQPTKRTRVVIPD